MISPPCYRQTLRPYRLLRTPAVCPFMISPPCCRQTLRPYRLLQTPANCPFMISPPCCRQTLRPFRLLQTPANCPFMISPPCCRQHLKSFSRQVNTLLSRKSEFLPTHKHCSSIFERLRTGVDAPAHVTRAVTLTRMSCYGDFVGVHDPRHCPESPNTPALTTHQLVLDGQRSSKE
jgi:hypothetical protein